MRAIVGTVGARRATWGTSAAVPRGGIPIRPHHANIAVGLVRAAETQIAAGDLTSSVSGVDVALADASCVLNEHVG